MWNYKCHKALARCVYPFRWVCEFFLELSWTYAHYKNGRFQEKNPNSTYFKNLTFWGACVSAKCRANNNMNGD